jgi:hypothetical protein
MNTNRLSLRDRFDRHVVRTEGCWKWTGAKMPNGYGKFGMPKGTSHRKPWMAKLAHRIAYEIANGEIPEGLQVLHHCDNPACVKPAHLFVGTQKENIADMYSKGRESGCGVRGESNPSARFEAKDAALMRLLADCGVKQHRLIPLFGVTRSTVSRVALRKSWAHVPDLVAPEATQ